jgi:adenosylcobinamide-phosphate synthase
LLIDIESQNLVLVAALALDRIVGDPDWLWRRLPHPVVLFGALIGLLDRALNRGKARQWKGVVALLAMLGAAVIAGVVIRIVLAELGIVGFLVEIVFVAIFLAQKSLGDHVHAIVTALRSDGLEGGRRAVSMIVGRDPATLDGPAVCRAAIESLAENFSDGVVAPALWYAVFGLPGLFAYKMLNTADSMIGHRNERYADFGRAAAIADDWANWPAARLSALLIAAGAVVAHGLKSGRRALGVALTDHGLHRSPNAGWPEAAMAGALDLALAGPRIYGGERVTEPMLNAAGRRSATAGNIEDALDVYGATLNAGLLLVGILAALTACA